MAGEYIFEAWRRRAGDAITGTQGGRPSLRLDVKATDSHDQRTGQPTVLLHGPGDVAGLLPGAVSGQWPRNGQIDAEAAYCPYVEFTAADLPWRYSPAGANGDVMAPWLALLVVADSEVDHLGGGTVTLTAAALAGHAPSTIDDAAHVQTTTTAWAGHHTLSRILCLRPLEDDTDYLAVMVPVWKDNGTERRWDGSRAETLPVYHVWRFRTSEGGTFRDLAEQLHAADELAGFGTVRVQLSGAEHETVTVRGALTGIDQVSDAPAPPAAVSRLAALRAIRPADAAGRPYVKPPTYGSAWRPDVLQAAVAGGWVTQVESDPTHRVVAGLGLQAGVDLQDEIAAAGAARSGALAAANQRIAALTLGLMAATSVWDRRLPDDLGGRLAVLGLASPRILSVQAGEPTDGVPLIDRATGADRTLPAALFSSAARRVLRPGAARMRHAHPGATAIVEQANKIRPALRRPEDSAAHGDALDGIAHADALVTWTLANSGPLRSGETDIVTGRQLAGALRDVPERIATALGRAEAPFERVPPRPADLVAFHNALVDALDPRRSVSIYRVLGTISPSDPEPLAPREPCLPLDLPAWRYLRDRAPEWLLPGATTLGDGEVVGLASNPVFVDAFLLGLNTQAVAELRWRNIRLAAGCTPLRFFWDRFSRGEDPDAGDITGLAGWTGPSGGVDPRALPLGANEHAPPGESLRRQLVIAFCTDLFRRYPGTLVYLSPPNPKWQDADLGTRRPPAFTAQITPRLVLFAFDVDPAALVDHWVVVEQAPPGFRFDRRKDSGGHAGRRAATMLERPVRVLLAGESLKGGA